MSEVLKVLHVLDHSLPLHSGYAFRTESILRAQMNHQIDVLSVTGPKQGSSTDWVYEEGGLQFHRSTLAEESSNSPLGQLQTVTTLRRKLKQLCQEVEPDVLHAHSPCLNGLAALGHGIPVVYEVRATWEDAAVASGTTHPGSFRYNLTRQLESFVMGRVDAGVVICDGLRDDFLSRGFAPEQISVVGNAINPETYRRPDTHETDALRQRLGLAGKTVIGFFGSFYRYEGLPLLLEAMAELKDKFPELHVLLAGGGEDEDVIAQRLTTDLKDCATFVGRVAHDEIATYYGISDIVVFPRLQERLTDIVTPLKPLEGMYFGSLVIASDVGGHRELVQNDTTGMLFEAGKVDSLVQCISSAMDNQAAWPNMQKTALDWLMRERTWDAMAVRYRGIYEATVQKARR